MDNLLVKTSSCFLISSIYCFNYYQYILCILLFTLFITSSIHHSYHANINNYKYGYIIGPIDKILAHIITLQCTYLCIKYHIFSPILCIIYVFLIYYLKIFNKPLNIYWHCSIHIISNFGVILILILI